MCCKACDVLSPNGSVHPHHPRNGRSLTTTDWTQLSFLAMPGKSQVGTLWHPNFFCDFPESLRLDRMHFSPLHVLIGMFTFTVKKGDLIYSFKPDIKLSEQYLNLLCLKTISRCCAILVLVSADWKMITFLRSKIIAAKLEWSSALLYVNLEWLRPNNNAAIFALSTVNALSEHD